MKKGLTLLLLVAAMLSSCFDANGYWTDTQTENMTQFAETMFDEIKKIITNYDTLITEESYGGSYRLSDTVDGCFIHFSRISFTIQECSYSVRLNIVPNENNEATMHDIGLIVGGPRYTNPDECVFYKNDFIVMNDLLDYLDNFVSAKSFVNLDKIENYLYIAKENNSYELMGGEYEEIINDRQHMVDYQGWFLYVSNYKNSSYYNRFALTFSKCPGNFE